MGYKINHRGTIEERFWSKIRKTTDCWLWEGSKSSGYGKICVNNKSVSVHRISFILHKGKIPKGMSVLHTCDEPSCVNPNHLWVGTHRENMMDRDNKGRSGTAKLNRKKVKEIRNIYSTRDCTQEELGKQFGVSTTAISNIIKNKRWIYA